MHKLVYFGIYLITVIAGATLSQLLPPEYIYIIGFATGAISQVFLTLFLYN